MTKADHTLAILVLLRARKKMTAKQLAQELEIHIRLFIVTSMRYVSAACRSFRRTDAMKGSITFFPRFLRPR